MGKVGKSAESRGRGKREGRAGEGWCWKEREGSETGKYLSLLLFITSGPEDKLACSSNQKHRISSSFTPHLLPERGVQIISQHTRARAHWKFENYIALF